MALRTLQYYSNVKLPCVGCSPANVIICVKEGVTTDQICPNLGNAKFIYGQVINYVLLEQCNRYVHRYLLEYDDVDTNGEALVTNDIKGIVCEGCQTDWVKELVGQPVTVTENSPGNYTIINQYGCPFTVTFAVTVSDTNTLNLSLTDNTLSGDVRISEDDNNCIEARDDGLYVSCAEISGSDSLTSIGLSPGGANVLQHTAVDGTEYNFCEGVCTFDISAPCDGVGPTQMLRSASIVGGALRLRSAPEHTVHLGGGGQQDVNVSQAVSAGTVVGPEIAPIIFANPSNCRQMRFMVTGKAFFDIIKPAVGEWQLTAEITNGSGGVLVGETIRLSSAYDGVMEISLQATSDELIGGPMAPGTSVTYGLRGRITAVGATPGSTWTKYTSSMRMMGVTV